MRRTLTTFVLALWITAGTGSNVSSSQTAEAAMLPPKMMFYEVSSVQCRCSCGANHTIIGTIRQILERSPMQPCVCGQTDLSAVLREFSEHLQRLKTIAASN